MSVIVRYGRSSNDPRMCSTQSPVRRRGRTKIAISPRCEALAFDFRDGGGMVAGEIGFEEFLGAGRSKFEFRRAMNLDSHVRGTAIEHMAAGRAVGGDEMQMIAGHVDAAQIVRREKSDDGSFDVVKLEDRFFARGLFETH